MNTVLVRYGEIGTKSSFVQNQMLDLLRQRVEDRLEHEELEYGSVHRIQGRVVAELDAATRAVEPLTEVPGVASVSPALKTGATLEALKRGSEEFDYGDSFGVNASRTGEHPFDSREINEQLGAHVEDFSGASVDLDDPETWLGVDVRNDDAYLYTEKAEGPGGYPVGSQETLLALISGGIDSPVAAHEVMKRGSDIVPVYFYNRPVAAEDHLLRFKSSVGKLKRFHPSKKWEAYVVDLEDVNRRLMEVERGRMVLHRIVMFRTASKIAEEKSLDAIVTGESLGQKSSQTAVNLSLTSNQAEKPVFRPLLTWNKNEITREARRLGTFEDATIASACSTMAPENPATSLKPGQLESLKQDVDIDALVEKAVENAEKVTL